MHAGSLGGLVPSEGAAAGQWACLSGTPARKTAGCVVCWSRFVCREYLGDRAENSAAFLAPIDPDAVVYGSGNEAVVLSKQQVCCAAPCCAVLCCAHPAFVLSLVVLRAKGIGLGTAAGPNGPIQATLCIVAWAPLQAARLYAMNMQQYGELKTRLMAINAGLVGLGTAAIFAHGGLAWPGIALAAWLPAAGLSCLYHCATALCPQLSTLAAPFMPVIMSLYAEPLPICMAPAGGSTLAAPFALGGGSGMLYQLLLMAAVDSVGPAPGGVYKAQVWRYLHCHGLAAASHVACQFGVRRASPVLPHCKCT